MCLLIVSLQIFSYLGILCHLENIEHSILAGTISNHGNVAYFSSPKTLTLDNLITAFDNLTYSYTSDYETLENGEKRKPWISLSGDDDGKHYVMYPKSEDKDNWEYDLHLIIDTGKH